MGLLLFAHYARPYTKFLTVPSIRNFLTGSALTLVVDLVFTFIFFAVMFYYAPTLSWVVVGSIPFYVVLSVAATPVLRRRVEEKFRRGAENQSMLVESVTGIETVKALAVEPQMTRRWEEQLAAYVQTSFAASSFGSATGQATQLVQKITTALTLWFGARLGDILNTRPEPAVGGASLPAIRGDVRFDDVTFRYRSDGREILKKVAIAVPAGQVVGVVGPSGSGKSTLTKLIQRLYLPESGRVLIDGTDIATIDPAWLRRQIGVVLQDNYLFNRSVRENIALAEPALSLERIMEAARLAGAHDFICELPEGYDSVIGERGGTLSGGQRQRIAIARALVTNPRVLIFDEATSALDYESEEIIQANMRGICQGRTVFIIAHRLSTVRDCDRIIAVDHGEVVEDGTHGDLLRQDGRYARLWKCQSAGAPEEPSVVRRPIRLRMVTEPG